MKKCTFKKKKEKQVRLLEDEEDIYLEGKRVGWISPMSYHQNYCRAFLWVKNTPNEYEPDTFRVVELSKKTKTTAEMKEWLEEKTESILALFDLYLVEE